MTRPYIEAIKHVIADRLDVGLTIEEIDETRTLFEGGLGLDSITIVDLIASLEEHFGFEFSESEMSMDKFGSVQSLAQFIARKLVAQGN